MVTISEAEHERIRNAVRAAESSTSGEIVCCLVEASGSYPIADLKSTTFGAVSAVLVGLLTLVGNRGWGLGWLETAGGIVFVALLGALLFGALAFAIPSVRRFFAGSDRMARRVRLQAFRAFVEEEVFATRDRTGILLFISMFEHRVEVVADKGINSVVSENAWADVVSLILDGIKAGTLTDGLIAGIERCGSILQDRGVAVRTPDPNELSDDLRIKRDL